MFYNNLKQIEKGFIQARAQDFDLEGAINSEIFLMILSGILRDETMSEKLMFILHYDQQNYPFYGFRLFLLVCTNQ